MRRALLIAGMVVLLVLTMVSAAAAHVHGITPLSDLGCKVDNTIAGAGRR